MAKFQKGNAGKPKGAQNKLTKTVREAVELAFNQMQEDPTKKYSLITWGKENPKDFYAIAAKLIPVQMDLKGELKIGLDSEIYERKAE